MKIPVTMVLNKCFIRKILLTQCYFIGFDKNWIWFRILNFLNIQRQSPVLKSQPLKIDFSRNIPSHRLFGWHNFQTQILIYKLDGHFNGHKIWPAIIPIIFELQILKCIFSCFLNFQLDAFFVETGRQNWLHIMGMGTL